MKSIQRKDFVRVGAIVKTHGTQGELKVQTSHNLSKWAFLEIQGKPVPFIVTSFQFMHDDEGILKLEGVDTVEAAAKLTGYEILVAQTRKLKEQHVNDSVVGYTLIDATHGQLGVVEELVELPMQLLLKSTHNNEELLIPAVEAFISDIDDEAKIIYLELPDGLIQ